MVRNVIKVCYLVCDAVYFIPVAKIKQWYTSYEKKWKTIVSLNIVILAKLKAQSINDVSIPDIASNKFRGDAIRLGDVYVCDVTLN